MWDIDDLDEAALYLFANLERRVADTRAGVQAIERVKAAWRAKFERH